MKRCERRRQSRARKQNDKPCRRFRERQRQSKNETKRNAEPSHELTEARAEIERLRAELAQENFAARHARHQVALLRDEIEKLKAKIVKPVKLPLDPEGEAARQIEALKKKNKALQQEEQRLRMRLATLVPSEVRTKVAKALAEQTTSPARRLDALQAWHGLGLNNAGRG